MSDETGPQPAEDDDPRDPAEREAAADERDAVELSLIGIVNLLLRRRRVVVGLSVSAAVLVVVVSLLFPRTWSSSATFLPEDDQIQSSQLSSLAAQFGVSAPLPGSSGQSPEFYADLMQSQSLLKEVVKTRYPNDTSGSKPQRAGRELVSYYGIHEETPEREVAEAVEELRDDLSVSTVRETGVVRFSVSLESPDLAYQVADRILTLVNRFDRQTRQTQAAAEAQFLAERVAEAQSELLTAEDSLERFLENNRQYQSSPRLRFEQQRLQRRVELRQQVYRSLAESYEEARISRVRNTPVITVVEPPEVPVKPDRRYLTLRALLALVLGFLVGTMWSFGVEFLRGVERQQPAEYEEFQSLWANTLEGVKARWLRFLARFRGGSSRPRAE